MLTQPYILISSSIIILIGIYRLRQYSISKVSKLLHFLYMLSAIAALFISEELLPSYSFNAYSPLWFFIFGALIIIGLNPSRQILKVKSIDEPFVKKVFRISVYISIPLILYAFIYLVPYAIQGVLMGALDVRHLGNVEDTFLLPRTMLTTIAVAIALFYSYFTMLFYLSLIFNSSLFYKAILFIGTFLIVIHGFTFMTRDGMVFFALTHLFYYFMLMDFFNLKIKRVLKRINIALIATMVFILSFLTVQRFDIYGFNSFYFTFQKGVLNYIGQQPYVFSETILKQDQFYNLRLRFTFIAELFGIKGDVERMYPYETNFGTYLKDFYSAYGFSSLIVIFLLFYISFKVSIKKSKRTNVFSYLIITGFYFQFMAQGLFYFRLGSYSGNIYIILVILLYYLYKVLLPKKTIAYYD